MRIFGAVYGCLYSTYSSFLQQVFAKSLEHICKSIEQVILIETLLQMMILSSAITVIKYIAHNRGILL